MNKATTKLNHRVSAFVLSTSLCAVAWGQTGKQDAPVSNPPAPAVAAPSATGPVSKSHSIDEPDLTRETQAGVREPDYAGLVWWIPMEFWLQAGAKKGQPPEKTAETFKALRGYTVVGIFVSKVSNLGGFEFVSPADLRRSVVLRDASGVDYSSTQELVPDAKAIASIIKPLLANALGKAGENFEILFFPASDKNGKPIADAKGKGSFSVVLKDIAGVHESIYQWRLPLTSVTEPKYCPVGKERVNANWTYCPWHGATLDVH